MICIYQLLDLASSDNDGDNIEENISITSRNVQTKFKPPLSSFSREKITKPIANDVTKIAKQKELKKDLIKSNQDNKMKLKNIVVNTYDNDKLHKNNSKLDEKNENDTCAKPQKKHSIKSANERETKYKEKRYEKSASLMLPILNGRKPRDEV